ncbi:MAG: hypothetical protein DYG93_06490 [Leptolyngbya sp. PLA2]|nr:hypothetical protein [Leptolyngbya sp.]MCE7971297.1 hypothetical protein [Leptolyngbya sp. PL-A2]MCQ3939656.1 hypothetical protein [cyanobacterium CYA1]MCZ7632098.1 hypothetical protein [Phycisphaerales bacterium]MDL1903913.1 hypothetical protein [Synechococcales cyanobacterium CNB]GIK18676.1 MAG: hypothetical protein BroJett004_08400 [Planctomycetota bacterium]
MEAGLAGAVAQFGAAGLVGWMWLTERRAAASRERQLAEAHDALARERTSLDALLSTVGANTRAMAGVEGAVRDLSGAIERLRSACDTGARGARRPTGPSPARYTGPR